MVDGEAKSYEIDYTGKMHYFDNQKYHLSPNRRFYWRKYGKFKFEKSPDTMIKEIESDLMKNRVSAQHLKEHRKHKK